MRENPKIPECFEKKSEKFSAKFVSFWE